MDLLFKYFRFKSFNADLTLDFWLNVMKMSLESSVDNGSKVRSVFQYANDSVGLRFEYDKTQKKSAKMEVLLHNPQINGPALMVYTSSVAEYAARAQDHGYIVYVEPQLISGDIYSTVLVDPNGILVRIVESDYIWPVSPNNKSAARLGYCTLMVKDHERLDRNINFYENTCSTPALMATRRGFKFEGAKRAKEAYFRVVDQERFVEDLTLYTWMGNGSRERFTTICFKHKYARAASGVQFKQNSILNQQSFKTLEKGDSKVFLGLVFHVSEIDIALSHLISTKTIPSSYEPQSIPGFARFIYFLDLLSVPIEISDGILTRYKSEKKADKDVEEADLRPIFRPPEFLDGEESKDDGQSRKSTAEPSRKGTAESAKNGSADNLSRKNTAAPSLKK